MSRRRDNYAAWSINERDFPRNGSIEDKIKFLIGYGVLAPSTHNTQPWAFVIDANQLIIYPNKHLQLPEADPTGRNLYISLGACVCNIRKAAIYFGLNTDKKIIYNSEGETQIEIIFTKTKERLDKSVKAQFEAIINRYSEKRVLDSIKLNKDDWTALKISLPQSIKLSYTTESKVIKKLADDVFKAAASYSAQPLFGRELSAWMRANQTKSGDGMTGKASGLTTGKVVVGKVLMSRVPKSMSVFAKKYLEQTLTSPALGLISSVHDTPEDWIVAGEVYEELALKAVSRSISFGPMAALIETNYRNKLAFRFDNVEKFPQMFFRLVKVTDDVVHSPRRTNIQVSLVTVDNKFLKILKSPAVSRLIDINKYKLHYVIAGEGQPIVFLHGANTGWGQWYPNIDFFAKNYQVYALDLPGTGQSTRFDYRQADFNKDYVEVVAEFVKKLNLKKVKLVGHSFGAAIAAKLALLHPELVDQIVLVNPLGLIEKVPLKQRGVTIHSFAQLLANTAMKPSRKNMKSFLESAVYDKNIISDSFVDYYYDVIRQDKRSHPLLFMEGQTRGFNFNPALIYRGELEQIKQPLLVILGENDPLLPSHKIATLVRNAKNVKLKMFKQTGHVTSLEQSNLFNKVVADFFEK